MDEFERKVLATLRNHSLLQEGDRVVVALSGGPDSTALLLAVCAIASPLCLQVSAAHVNHRLRSEESDQDEVFIRELCRRHRLDLEVGHCPASVPPGNLEMQTRELRYSFLSGIAQQRNASLATGHTMEDQAETVLMKLVRGAGPTGLSAVHPKRKRWEAGAQVLVVRPLIECRRAEILQYLQRRGQSFRTDSSNADLSLDRNWVRNQLIPLLQERLNPKVVPALCRTASLFLEISEYLEQQAGSALPKCQVPGDDLALKIKPLLSLPGILQKEVVRRVLKQARGNLDGIDFVHLLDILSVADGTSGRSVNLPGNWRAEREFANLRLTDLPLTGQFEKNLTVPADFYVKELGCRVQLNRTRSDRKALRLGCNTDRLLLRTWRPGDRFLVRPGVRRRLKDIFQEKRIPRSERRRLLILVSADELIWVQGIGIASGFEDPGTGKTCLELVII